MHSTLLCYNPFIFGPIIFKIDTGADVTTISLNDALRLKIDFNKLGKPFDVLTGSGLTSAYNILDSFLGFDLGNCILTEKISPIDISRPEVTIENATTIKNIPSLLGTDFLQRYTIRYDGNLIYLDR